MNYLNKLFTLNVCLLYGSLLFAQPKEYDLPTLAKSYKGHDAVMLSSKSNLVIDFDDWDKIRIRNKHSHDVYFVGPNTKRYTDEYISYSSFNDVQNIDVSLYDYTGKGFKKKKITDIVQNNSFGGSTFYDDYKSLRVVFPSISQGSVSTVSYDETYTDPHVIGSYYFSSYMPVDKSEISVEFPKNVSITYKLFNDNGKIKYTEEKKGNKIKYTWTAHKLDQYDKHDEDFSIGYYEPHLCIYIKDYTFKNIKTEVFTNVGSLYKWYSSLIKNINNDEVPELKKLVDSLCLGKPSQYEKAKAIFYWVQSNIKYVAFEEGYSGLIPREAKDIFNNRYGDCKDMSSIQKKMYNLAGIDGRLVWIGTRDIPYTYEELPTGSVDNHMIATVFIDGKHYFTDGTAYYIPLDFPSDAIQGKEALIENGDSFIVEKVPVIAKEKNRSIDTLQLWLSADTLKGIAKSQYSGYIHFNTAINLIRTPQNKWKDYLSKQLNKGSNKCKLESFQVDSIERDKDLKIRSTFSIPNYVTKAGNSSYINMNLDKNLQGDNVDTARQKFDKKLDFKYIQSYITSLDVPKGYKVSKLPTTSEFNDKEFGFKTNYRYDESQRKIVYSFELYIDTITIKASRFDTWNDMIKHLGEAYSQVVVLEKM